MPAQTLHFQSSRHPGPTRAATPAHEVERIVLTRSVRHPLVQRIAEACERHGNPADGAFPGGAH